MAFRAVRESVFYFGILPLMLLFLYLTFDRDMANIYFLMIVATFIWWFLDVYHGNRRVDLPIERRTDNRLMAILYAGGAYLVFLLISSAIFSLFTKTSHLASMNSVIQLWATTTPILQGNVFLTILSWGIFVGTIETIAFFGRLPEFLQWGYKRIAGDTISLKSINSKSIMLMLFVSALFILFHVQSKGLSGPSLMVTGIFAMMSIGMVLYFGETKQAIIFHITANVSAVLALLNII